jgi:hypothetical protein
LKPAQAGLVPFTKGYKDSLKQTQLKKPNFFKLAQDQKENFVVSPLILHIALSMLANGASKLTDTR